MSDAIFHQAYQVFLQLDHIRSCMPWLTHSGATVTSIRWQQGDDQPTLIVDRPPNTDGLTVKCREGKNGNNFDYTDVQGCIVAWPVSKTPEGGEQV